MVARFEDLVCWRLCDELRREVCAFTANDAVRGDFKYRDQIRDAVSSACRNSAEGFGRFEHGDFRRFLTIAAASLHEVKDLLHEGHEKHYLDDATRNHLLSLTIRALKANSRLRQYLAAHRTPRHA
jgi:four helix bundle protein